MTWFLLLKILKNTFLLKSIIISFAFLASLQCFGQSWPEIKRITDSAGYAEMIPAVDSCLSYLQNTMPEDDLMGRMEAVRFLDNWITGVPFLYISQLTYLFDVTGKNEELITQHVAGKIHYWRLHPDVSTLSFESELEGVNWMLDLYANGSFVKTEKMDALLARRNEGTLEEWLQNKLPSSWLNSESTTQP